MSDKRFLPDGNKIIFTSGAFKVVQSKGLRAGEGPLPLYSVVLCSPNTSGCLSISLESHSNCLYLFLSAPSSPPPIYTSPFSPTLCFLLSPSPVSPHSRSVRRQHQRLKETSIVHCSLTRLDGRKEDKRGWHFSGTS